ncbi:MAG: hypothetical protein BIFFINMI_02446 [Phycisphaerae bacterium]|nr:hypothetical protein [Phycisphaerae bacterium]
MAEQEYEIQNKRMLIIAAVLGLVVVVLFNWHVAQIRKEYEETMVDVLTARVNLKEGEVLSNENMDYQRIPRRLVPEEFKGDLAMGSDRDAIIGMKLRTPVEAGKIIRWRYVTAGKEARERGVEPAKGRRLVAIKVSRDTCPPNLLVGMSIDLMTNVPGQGGSIQTVPVMQKILVKAINGNAVPGSTDRNIESISVEVLEEDAKLLESFKATGFLIKVWIRNQIEGTALTSDQSESRFNKDLIPFMRWDARGGSGPR